MYGLNKTIEFNNTGLNITHWDILEMRINYLGQHAYIILRGFASKAEKDSGAQPVTYKEIFIKNDPDAETPHTHFDDFLNGIENGIEAKLRNHLKVNDSEFVGATDED